MEHKYGKLVWTDEDDIERAYKAVGIEGFLEDMEAADAEQVIEQITRVFMYNGARRGRIFYNGSFQRYDRTDGPLRLPVYGVKGVHREKSISHYAHWYINKEADLLGEFFFNIIFDNCFRTEEEYRTLKKPEDIFRKEPECIVSKADIWHKSLALQIAEKLWTELVSDPSTRFVIVLPQNREGGNDSEKRAEEESLDILRQVYLLIPQKLRLTLGFATCVTPEEMINLAEREDLPIHVFTTDGGMDLAVLENAGYNYHIFKIDKKDDYVYDKEKLGFLEELLKYDAKGWLEQLLDKSEEEYLQKHGKAIDFGAYGAILDPIVVSWYDKDKQNNLFGLLKYREEQEGILSCGDLERERKYFFLSEILPQKDYGCQLARNMVAHAIGSAEGQNEKQDAHHDDMVEQISKKLGLGFLVDSIECVSKNWKRHHKKTIRKVEDGKKEKEEELRKLNELLTKKSMQLAELEKKIGEMEKWNDKLQEEKVKTDNQNKELNVKIDGQEKKIAELERKNQELLSNAVKRQEELQKINERLVDENKSLNEKNKALMEENKNINERLKKEKEQQELKQHDQWTMAKLEENDEKQSLQIQGLCEMIESKAEDHELIKKQMEELWQEVKVMKEKGKRFEWIRKKILTSNENNIKQEK